MRAFHERLPGFKPSPLLPLDSVAREIGVQHVLVKDESERLGLPAYKILGASWGVFRAVAARTGRLPLAATLPQAASAAQDARLVLFAATDGNYGRAVARMAALLGIGAEIFVPDWVGAQARRRIAGEGAAGVHVVVGDYDAAVAEAHEQANVTPGGLHVQDSAFEGYEEIPAWVVEGYGTMLAEVEEQLADRGLEASLLVTPVGAGSLCHAVVSHSRSNDRAVSVLAVEPDKAACLHESLKAGRIVAVTAEPGIMDGLTCPTVSPVSWPVLQAGVDASVTVSDYETHCAVQYLASHGVSAGPCGAAALAGLRRVAEDAPETVRLGPDSVIVILCTEGIRDYDVPERT